MIRRHDVLHPAIYRAIIVLTAVFVIAAWGFAVHGYTSLVIGVVTFFGLIAVVIPLELRHIWRLHRSENPNAAGSLREWLSSEFEIWQDHLNGRDAAVLLLLPIAAAAFGAIALSIVFQIVSLSR